MPKMGEEHVCHALHSCGLNDNPVVVFDEICQRLSGCGPCQDFDKIKSSRLRGDVF